MRTLVLYMSWPIILITLGGLLTLVGGLWQAKRQAQTAEEAKLANSKVLALTQQIAARGGDQKTLDELIETRTRLLAADRRINDDMIQNIVAQLPKMTEDYDKLRQDTARYRAGKETDFRLGWEPFIRFAVAEFDKRISELRANGISGDGGTTDTFPITNSNPSMTNVAYQVGVVNFGGKAAIHLDYNSYFPPMNKLPEKPGALALRIGTAGVRFTGDPIYLSISMNLIEATMMPGGRVIKMPQDGMVSAEMTDAYRSALAKAIEQALVILRAETQ